MAAIGAAFATAVAAIGTASAAVTGFMAAPFVMAMGEGAAIAMAGGMLKTAAAFALSAGAMALIPPQVGSAGSPTAFKADPSAPITGVMGRFGIGGRQVHANVWGKANIFISFATVLSLGPIAGIEGFTANTTPVSFPLAQGEAARVEPYRDKMWMTYRLGLPGDSALGPPTGQAQGSPGMDEWTSAHRLPQFAHSFWTMRGNSKGAPYAQGVPPPKWTVLGMKVWDPAKDSTHPGGDGPQRRNDWRTWDYSDSPALHALAWTRGHYVLKPDGSIDRTKKLAGVGAPEAAIDIGSFVYAAAIAKANDWSIAGEWSTTDGKWQTQASMLQAGGAKPVTRGARIGVQVSAPRASILTLTAADVIGPVRLNVMRPRRDRINTIIPRYRSEAHGWEQVAAGAVTADVWREEDGGEVRSREQPYAFVADAGQAAQLAAYDLANLRETLTATIPCRLHLMAVTAGDAITVDLPEVGLNGQKFVVEGRTVDLMTGEVLLDLTSETDAKHDWALGRTPDPAPSPSLTTVDPLPPAPEPGEWTILPILIGEQVSQPAIGLTGEVPDGIDRMQVSVLLDAGYADPEDIPSTASWSPVYFGPPGAGQIPVAGLEPGGVYWVRIVYYTPAGVASAPYVTGPVTVGALVADVDPERLENARPFAEVRQSVRATMEELLKAAQDRAVASMNDRDSRRAEIRDLMIRQGLIAETDPVSGAAILRKDIVIEGEDGQTLAQTLDLLYASDGDLEAMVGLERLARISADAAESQARLNAMAASASALADAAVTLRAYSDARVTAATVDMATTGVVDSKLADARAAVSMEITEKTVTATAGLATVAQMTAADTAIKSAADISAKSLVDALEALVELNFVGRAEYGELESLVGIQGTAINGLDAQNALARLELFAEAAGGLPARLVLKSDLLGASLALMAGTIHFGEHTKYDDASQTFRTVSGSVRTVTHGPFGVNGDLVLWVGPNSTAKGSESKANAYVFVSTTAPRFGGSDTPSSSSLQVSLNRRSSGRNVTATGTFTTTDAITLTVTGGSGSYSYEYVVMSQSSDARPTSNIAPTATSGNTTLWAGTITQAGETLLGTALVVVKDTVLGISETVPITGRISHTA